MKKKVFVFEDAQEFEKSLLIFKQWRLGNGSPKIFFQIFSEILDENELRRVWTVIERVFPDVPWMGMSTAGNIEDCEVSGSSCTGITLGKYGDEYDNFSADSQRYSSTIARAAENGLARVGHHKVRRCKVFDCGQAGICGSLGAMFSSIEDCEIYDCHWKKPFGGAEMAGIKIHGAVDFTIARCRIHHCGWLGGIWFDWMAQGARIVDNVLWANEGYDFFAEVDHGPVLVEGNDFLSKNAFMSYSQSIAFVGNRLRGGYENHDDARRTPIFEPHTAVLHALDSDACTDGAHVFINNIMGEIPSLKKSSLLAMATWFWL